jgi:hypothetical protein
MAGPSSARLPLSAGFTIRGDSVTLATRTVHLTQSDVVHS